jgi:hypothetical protein
MKLLRKLFHILKLKEAKKTIEQKYLSNDKELREDTEARLKALEILVEIQTRGLNQRDTDTHH